MAENFPLGGGDAPISVFLVGDVLFDEPYVESALVHATPLLETADIVVGNCEGLYVDDPHHAPSAKHVMAVPRSAVRALGRAPFHVMTCAGNHMVDGGHAGLLSTLDAIHGENVKTVGAGANIAEAVAPCIIERYGKRIAFLAFGTVFPVGYEARVDVPGIAPLRVDTFYSVPNPNFWEPGIPPRITTVAQQPDLEQFRASIRAARDEADFVVVTCHWGFSSQMRSLQQYELDLARYAVDQGADAVLCCHHHSLRGVEFHSGVPIYYGLGAFIHHFSNFHVPSKDLEAVKKKQGEQAPGPREGFPLFPFHPDARMTGVAVLDFDGDRVEAGFIPADILADGSTKPHRAGTPEAHRIAEYLVGLNLEAGFTTEVHEGERDGWAYLRFRQFPRSEAHRLGSARGK